MLKQSKLIKLISKTRKNGEKYAIINRDKSIMGDKNKKKKRRSSVGHKRKGQTIPSLSNSGKLFMSEYIKTFDIDKALEVVPYNKAHAK